MESQQYQAELPLEFASLMLISYELKAFDEMTILSFLDKNYFVSRKVCSSNQKEDVYHSNL